jgi:2,4-diketo-3-deoxy-L-fuconate hydrolase
VELGVVIGRTARYVTLDEALDYAAGYCIVNDVSEREFQLERSGQWVKGKSCETFAPIGPWLVTRDEIPDPQNLALSTTVNGHRYQDGNTRDMVFGVAFLIHYLSQFMTLLPGDVIATGTPSGIGMALKPPVFLKPGDVMEVAVEGLGVQRQEVVAFDPAFFA